MKKTLLKWIENGGITSPQGYQAATCRAGIKESRKKDDMALLTTTVPATAAGMFTTNKVFAAPVQLCKENLKHGKINAIMINAGNANACTGAQGLKDAKATAREVAKALDLHEASVLVCSTGTIGIPMPMDKVLPAIPGLAKSLSPAQGEAAAKAIMTTDTVHKQFAVQFKIGGRTVTLGGMCKGAGMIEPNMATMLAYLTTDAAVQPSALKRCLQAAVNKSFNVISIDGDQSTNDTIIFLANGLAGNEPLSPAHPDWAVFAQAVEELTFKLSMLIVRDGEGVTKVVTLNVKGAASEADARKAARAVARSFLVKTSWFGGDPNWGRIMDAIGYSGINKLNQNKVNIQFDDFMAVRNGMRAPGTQLSDLEAIYRKPEFTITVDLCLGKGAYTMYTCDCSEEYVRINSEYMT